MTAFRIAFGSLGRALPQVRSWLCAWLLVTLPAAFLVLPVLRALRATYDHDPAATFELNQHLDLDFVRLHPDLAIAGGGAVLLVLLGWTFLGGGILAAAAASERPRFGEFLASCARLLPRNLRAIFVGLLLALLLGWGVGFLDDWLRNKALADVDPGAMWTPFGLHWRCFTVEFGLVAMHWVYGYLFLLLLFASKIARAHLCEDTTGSAVLAWLRAIGRMLRHPLRAALVVALLTTAYLLLQLVLGAVLAIGSKGADLWWMVPISQVGVVCAQIVLVAFFLAAHDFAGFARLRESPEELAPGPEPAAEFSLDLPHQ
jgi:hypothetical protein